MTPNIQSTQLLHEWLTPKQFEEEYQIKISTQNKMRRARKLPYSKVGNFIRYNRTKINKMFESAEVSA